MTGQTKGPDPTRRFYTKFNRAKEQLAKGNLQACLINLTEAIHSKIELQSQFMQREKRMIDDELYDFMNRVADHKLYKETYGPVSFAEGQEQDWLDFLSQLVTVSQDAIMGRLKEGVEHLEAERVDEARDVFNELMDDFSEDAGLAVDIGDRYMDFELWDDAEAAYRRAAAIDPDTVHIINRLAMSLRKEGQLAEAIKLYQRAIKLSPDDEGLYYNTARVLYEMTKFETACKVLKIALKKNPNFEPGKKFLDFMRKKHPEVGGCAEDD